MEKELGEFANICHELFENPSESSVKSFSEYMTKELNLGHIAQMSQSFKNITDVVEDLNETGNSTMGQLFNLDFHLIFPKVIDSLVDHDVICTPDAVESLSSLFGFLTTICEKSSSGKIKLVSIVPVVIRDIIVNAERGIPLRVEAVKLTNMILEDVVNDEVDPTDAVSLALKELYVQCEKNRKQAYGRLILVKGLLYLVFYHHSYILTNYFWYIVEFTY
ncbi:hypothetical protein ACROYT_G010967 [Oculina patagonica]